MKSNYSAVACLGILVSHDEMLKTKRRKLVLTAPDDVQPVWEDVEVFVLPAETLIKGHVVKNVDDIEGLSCVAVGDDSCEYFLGLILSTQPLDDVAVDTVFGTRWSPWDVCLWNTHAAIFGFLKKHGLTDLSERLRNDGIRFRVALIRS